MSEDALFQHLGSLLSGYPDHQGPVEGDLPVAEQVRGTTLKLPVWHREADIPLADAYVTALVKVATHHKDLMLE
ncbi:hypothetical protein [Streptomyces gobiensis]|uniref:hypothetical protein n=1 Tax=Streptomyces gobiensis TaxID=2875706 RepID=UPI001E54AFD7|nr:hypothetical protein [Streptomyces gobiensis]UGY94491.1 hypothetical protein test1122_24000 [Streptomyces gobiensis]